MICICFAVCRMFWFPMLFFYISGEASFCLSTWTCPPKFKVVYQCLSRGNVPQNGWNWTWISVAVFNTFCSSFGIGMHYPIDTLNQYGARFVFCTTVPLVSFFVCICGNYATFFLGFRIHSSCLKWWWHMMTRIHFIFSRKTVKRFNGSTVTHMCETRTWNNSTCLKGFILFGVRWHSDLVWKWVLHVG